MSQSITYGFLIAVEFDPEQTDALQIAQRLGDAVTFMDGVTFTDINTLGEIQTIDGPTDKEPTSPHDTSA